MAAGPAYIGVTEATDELVQSVEIESKLGIDVARKNRDGTFAVGHATDKVNTGTITILGTHAQEVGAALMITLASISGGKSHVGEKTHKVVNDNYDETTISFEHFPAATVG